MVGRIARRAAAAVVPAALVALGVMAFTAGGGKARLSLLGARPFHATQVVGDDFPKRLIDPSGVPQTIAAPPDRILSGVLAGDEILTALVAPERLAAVTYLVDEPGLSEVARLLPPDLPRLRGEPERMLALQPDLVVLASYTRATTVRLLASAGVPLVRFQWYRSFGDIMSSIRMLAAAVGADDNGARLVADMRQRIAEVEKRAQGLARPRVRAVLWGRRLFGRPGHAGGCHDHPGRWAQRGARRAPAGTGTAAPRGCREPAAGGDPGVRVGAAERRRPRHGVSAPPGVGRGTGRSRRPRLRH